MGSSRDPYLRPTQGPFSNKITSQAPGVQPATFWGPFFNQPQLSTLKNHEILPPPRPSLSSPEKTSGPGPLMGEPRVWEQGPRGLRGCWPSDAGSQAHPQEGRVWTSPHALFPQREELGSPGGDAHPHPPPPHTSPLPAQASHPPCDPSHVSRVPAPKHPTCPGSCAQAFCSPHPRKARPPPCIPSSAPLPPGVLPLAASGTLPLCSC